MTNEEPLTADDYFKHVAQEAIDDLSTEELDAFQDLADPETGKVNKELREQSTDYVYEIFEESYKYWYQTFNEYLTSARKQERGN